jgi:hypothetical protein
MKKKRVLFCSPFINLNFYLLLLAFLYGFIFIVLRCRLVLGAYHSHLH